jgi:hypothetical protein
MRTDRRRNMPNSVALANAEFIEDISNTPLGASVDERITGINTNYANNRLSNVWSV